MTLIPRPLRDPVVERPGPQRALRALYTGTEATIGGAAAATTPSIVEAAGVRAACPAYASCAVAFTRLERRGDRIWGVPCVGVGPVEPALELLPEARFDFHSNPAARASEIASPFAEPARLTVWGQLGDESRYPFGGFYTINQGGGFSYREGSGMVPGGFRLPAGVPRGPSDGGSITGYFVRPARAAIAPVVERYQAGAQATSGGSYGGRTFTNPFAETASVTLTGYVDDELVFNGARDFIPTPHNFSRTFTVARGGTFHLAVHNSPPQQGNANYWQIDATITWTVPGATVGRIPNWRTAPPLLEWVETGLPWWGVIEAAALSGQWVRRIAWSDPARRIRYEAGLGTTRAVAVTQTGERVTANDFGVEEFLGEDWRIVDAGEPLPVDVTDAIFTGASVIFSVGAAGGGTPGGGDTTPPEPIIVPKDGEGFLYVRGGKVVLVGAKDCDGATWRP